MTHSDLLVVDDDDSTRIGLTELLANAGFTVDVARDGAEALDKMASHDFSVVLLDVHLPRIGGLDVLARCSAKRHGPKVIVMTGVDTTDVVLDALRGHAYDFVPKPIDPSRLIDVVKRALSADTNIADIEVLSARPEWVELLVPCTREAADRIQSFLQQLEADLPDETRDSVGLAFRELLLNGIEWGGHLNPALLYRIADPGQGFTFDELSHAAVQHEAGVIVHDLVRNAKGLRPGGFGLMLIRAIADELIYNERKNEVVFLKYLDEPCREDRRADERQGSVERAGSEVARNGT